MALKRYPYSKNNSLKTVISSLSFVYPRENMPIIFSKGYDILKKIIVSFSIALAVCLVASICRDISDLERMTDKLIRLHVVADSDSDYSQQIKLKVRDEALNYVSELTKNCSSKAAAQDVIVSNLDGIRDISEKVLRENGCNLSAAVSYEKTLVDRREYDSFTLPQGIYSALCIRIGEAKGKNWWCILYPSLCVSSAVDIEESGDFSEEELLVVKEPEKVKYKLALFELFEKLCSKINGLNSLHR